MMLSTKLNMGADELCRTVLTMNSQIMFVGVINQRGRFEEVQSRDTIIDRLPSTKKDMFLMENALKYRMGQEFNEDLGAVKFTYVERSKRVLLSIPMGDQFMLVSLRKHVNSVELARNIKRLINRYEKNLKIIQ